MALSSSYTNKRLLKKSGKLPPIGTGEIGFAMKQMVAPTNQYTRDESERMVRETPDMLKDVVTEVASPLAWLIPGVTRKGLLEEIETRQKERAGFGGVAGDLAGDALSKAVMFKAMSSMGKFSPGEIKKKLLKKATEKRPPSVFEKLMSKIVKGQKISPKKEAEWEQLLKQLKNKNASMKLKPASTPAQLNDKFKMLMENKKTALDSQLKVAIQKQAARKAAGGYSRTTGPPVKIHDYIDKHAKSMYKGLKGEVPPYVLRSSVEGERFLRNTGGGLN